MSEVADVRKRVQRLIAQSREAATDRRARAAVAAREGKRVLTQVVAPMFRTVAAVLRAEGLLFRVSTPVSSVRISAEAASENFVELELDTTDDSPALRGRISRMRGKRVTVRERVVSEDSAIGTLTKADVLDFLLCELGPFLEK